jgi:hypothetical protein
VVLTTSNVDEDISYCYTNGADAYFTKPKKFTEWVEIVGALERYAAVPLGSRAGGTPTHRQGKERQLEKDAF